MVESEVGISLALILNVSVVLFVVLLSYKYWGQEDMTADKWYDEVEALAKEVQDSVNTEETVTIDNNKLQRKLIPLSNRLKKHSRNVPEGVNKKVVRETYDLSMACWKLGFETPPKKGILIEDEKENIVEKAKKLEKHVSEEENLAK